MTRKKVYTCSIQTQLFFLNISDLWFVESTVGEPTDSRTDINGYSKIFQNMGKIIVKDEEYFQDM